MEAFLPAIKFLSESYNMKIRFTSIAWEEVSEQLSKVMVHLEKHFNTAFSDLSYGADVTQFTVVAIAVDSVMDSNQNEKFVKRHNKSGSYKHPLTGDKVKYISFALGYRHENLEGKDESELRRIFCTNLYNRMEAPFIKIPKGFDYQKFSSEMKFALEKFI
jgi:hypothetical protein